MEDIGLSAFSLFFMQSESFLSHQRSLEERQNTSNCQTLFGMTKIPTDNHIRSMLDPVHPSHLQGVIESYYSMLAATIVAPRHDMVVPLMPEFIIRPNVAEKQDCERNAAKRWLAAHGERVKSLAFLGDHLFACQPVGQPILASGGDFLFTAKRDPTRHCTIS